MLNLTHKNLVAIDIETSGTNPFMHDVLAIGLVPINKKIPPKTVYVRHQSIHWSDYAHHIFSKYSMEWNEKSVPPVVACQEIEKYLQENFKGRLVTPVGHNIGFDLTFLRKLAFQSARDQISGISHRAVDTHTLLYVLALEKKIPSDAVTSDGAFSHFGIEIDANKRHTATGDAEATSVLLEKILEKFPQ